jgi:hypothetical protein
MNRQYRNKTKNYEKIKIEQLEMKLQTTLLKKMTLKNKTSDFSDRRALFRAMEIIVQASVTKI